MAQSTQAQPAYNTILKVCSDASGTGPTAIAEVRDLDLDLSSRVEEVTPQSSGRGTCKIVTLTDVKCTATLNFLPAAATHNDSAGLHYLWKNGIERTFQFCENDSTTIYQFNALVTNIKHSRAVAGARTAQVTFDGTGEVDLSA